MNSGGKRTLLSVVAAAHNEAANIAAMHEAISQAVTALDVDLELIFVDDGSSDATAKIVDDLSARDDRIRLIALTRNFGHQAAVYAGLSAANGQAIIVLDCDLQHPPALIPKMVDAWRMGYSVVQMVRDHHPATRSMKQATSRAFYRLINLISDTQILEGAADFRLLDRAALDALLSLGDKRLFLRGMVSWMGFPSTIIHYAASARVGGRSAYTWRRMISLAVDAITAFSVAPLRVAFYCGCISAVIAMLYFVFVLYSVAVGRTVEGWTSLMIALLFFGSAQLVTLGIVGEYIGRIYDQTRARPRYLVKQATPGDIVCGRADQQSERRLD
jgi:glycosyltransferase involved in cell wall biosynthesis